MRRREFVSLLRGAVATWPLAAHAQQPDKIRLIGAISGIAEEPNIRARFAAFVQALQELGWDDRNVRIVYRYGIIIQLPHRTIKYTFVLTSDGLSAVRESSIIGAVCFEHRRHV